MTKFILETLFLNSFEAIFIMLFILFIYVKRYDFEMKDFIILIIISIASHYIQMKNMPLGLGNLMGMFLYYIMFRIFYFKGKRLSLIRTIVVAFVSLLALQFIIYSPLILFLGLNIYEIHHNILYLLIITMPVNAIEILLLFILKKRKD